VFNEKNVQAMLRNLRRYRKHVGKMLHPYLKTNPVSHYEIKKLWEAGDEIRMRIREEHLKKYTEEDIKEAEKRWGNEEQLISK
jgi:hypothetical protein